MVYDNRPAAICGDFKCMWLQAQELPQFKMMYGVEELRPDRCHAVVTARAKVGGLVFQIDPHYPSAAETGPVKRMIDHFVSKGLTVVVAVGEKRKLYGQIKQGEWNGIEREAQGNPEGSSQPGSEDERREAQG